MFHHKDKKRLLKILLTFIAIGFCLFLSGNFVAHVHAATNLDPGDCVVVDDANNNHETVGSCADGKLGFVAAASTASASASCYTITDNQRSNTVSVDTMDCASASGKCHEILITNGHGTEPSDIDCATAEARTLFGQAATTAASSDLCYQLDSNAGTERLEQIDCTSGMPSATTNAPITPIANGNYQGQYSCGGSGDVVNISIDIGCRHQGNPILDMLFAIIRILSLGVGLVIVASLIVAGIQFTSSRGDPQATAKALGRVYNTVGALLLFIFAYAIINWLVPSGLLK